MLKKRDRLASRDIGTLTEGKSVFGTLISLRFKGSGSTKISVSVSKKVCPRAVDRSRVRRRVYASLEKLVDRINGKFFVLVMPKKDCLKAPFEAICADMERVFSKAKILG